MTTPTDTDLAQALRLLIAAHEEVLGDGLTSFNEPVELRRAKQALAAHERAQPDRNPDGCAYRYRCPDGGTVIRFNHGEAVNGSKPIETIPFYYGQPPAQPASVPDDAIERAVRAHDREDAAQKGEPDPWADEFPEPYRSERMTAMRLALEAAQPASVAPDVQIEVHPKGKRYQVWLIRAHQSFEVGPSRDEFAEAKWYADMLAKALWPERDAAPQPAKDGE